MAGSRYGLQQAFRRQAAASEMDCVQPEVKRPNVACARWSTEKQHLRPFLPQRLGRGCELKTSGAFQIEAKINRAPRRVRWSRSEGRRRDRGPVPLARTLIGNTLPAQRKPRIHLSGKRNYVTTDRERRPDCCRVQLGISGFRPIIATRDRVHVFDNVELARRLRAPRRGSAAGKCVDSGGRVRFWLW